MCFISIVSQIKKKNTDSAHQIFKENILAPNQKSTLFFQISWETLFLWNSENKLRIPRKCEILGQLFLEIKIFFHKRP